MIWLGVDPGAAGAAVLMADDGVTALGAWAWKRRRNKAQTWYLWSVHRGVDQGDPAELESMHDVSVQIAERLQDCNGVEIPMRWAGVDLVGMADVQLIGIVVEDLFIAEGKSPQGFIELAELTGEAIGPLRGLGPITRVNPSTWRGKVLRLGMYTSSKNCDRKAAQACELHAGGSLGSLLGNGHVHDAWCIARYGWGLAVARARRTG